jgi:hypothetical protein
MEISITLKALRKYYERFIGSFEIMINGVFGFCLISTDSGVMRTENSFTVLSCFVTTR